jgi:Zn finger protein HypA/HybF involved in hydrogenase expression
MACSEVACTKCSWQEMTNHNILVCPMCAGPVVTIGHDEDFSDHFEDEVFDDEP